MQRLASHPGVHTGNVHRQNATQAMVQLLSILTSAQISKASPMSTQQRADEFSNNNRRHDQMNSRSVSIGKPMPSTSLAAVQSPQNPQSPVQPANSDAQGFASRDKTFRTALRQKRSLTSRNIPNKILDIMGDSRFDYRLTNKLDEIFRLAERAPDTKAASAEDKNVFILLTCIRQMRLYIKDHNLPSTDEAQAMLDMLVNLANTLDKPHE